MSHSISPMSRQRDESVAAPSLRINRSANLVLSTTWQDVVWNGTSGGNRNTYPKPIVGLTSNVLDSTQPMVYLSADMKLLRFQGIVNKTYDLLVNSKITSSAALTALNLSLTTVQLRFVVPSPTPIYFPLPDLADACTDLVTVGLMTTPQYPSYGLPITANAAAQQYGLGVQMRLSSSFLGTATATVNAVDLILYGR